MSLLLLGGGAAWAQQDVEQPVAAQTEVSAADEGAADQYVPSEEVNSVQESEVADDMTQAEKAENVKENDSWGGAITIISMTIVLSALIVLSILFLGFGKISSKLLSRKKMQSHGVDSKADSEDHVSEVDSGETIAAISAALAEHFSGEHDMEDTILTIRRMKKAYSPWNSKIYGLRETPVLQHNPARPLPKNLNVR